MLVDKMFVDAVAEVEVLGIGSVHDVMALLHAVWLHDGLSVGELDALMARGESAFNEALASGELLVPHVRDGEVGPWDVGEEVPARRDGRIDLGALKVPVISGMRIRPETVEGGGVLGVTVKMGAAFLQLQVFASAGELWNRVPPGLASQILARGGQASEGVGRFGSEIRGTLPTSGEKPVAVRYIGCEGPGWMLRGVLTGPEADADVPSESLRRIFVDTIVDIRDANVESDTPVPLKWPPLAGWSEEEVSLFDVFTAGGELFVPSVRDGVAGPWDAGEAMPAGRGGVIDLGALKVPVVPRMRIRPKGEAGLVRSVVVKVGSDALELQVYRMPEGGAWERVRGELFDKIAALGVGIREVVGQLGAELRVAETLSADGREQEQQPLRFVGCDGPGWLLRGVLTGPNADADLLVEELRQVFIGSVVDLGVSVSPEDSGVPLQWPPLGGWNEDEVPLFE